MLKSIIRTLLQKFIDDIDSDNCNITMEQQSKIISMLEMDSFRKESNRKVLKS